MSEHGQITSSGWERRGYDSFVRFLAAVAGGSAGGELLRRDGVVASIAPAARDRSLFNTVLYDDARALAAALDDLRDAYRQAGVLAWTVWVPESDPASAELLASRGHRLDAAPRQMKLELADVPEADTEGFELTRTADWPTLCAVNDAAYGLPEGTFEAGLGSKADPSFRAYGAIHGGWVASVAATVLNAGDCGVYAVATLPEARGLHLAAGLLHRALLDARERGCETSTLQSSRMGLGVYRRLGYRDLGGLEMWEHRTFPG